MVFAPLIYNKKMNEKSCAALFVLHSFEMLYLKTVFFATQNLLLFGVKVIVVNIAGEELVRHNTYLL